MERIDKFIEEQKQIEPSPFLESKILAKIEGVTVESIPYWYKVVALSATAAVIALALYVGTLFSPLNESSGGGLLVNDYYLEQLSIYETNETE